MATIRPVQIGAVNNAGSNDLLSRAQQMILGGLGGLNSTLGDYRNSIVNNNTAGALSLLTGATDTADLAKRQQAVGQLIQQAGGDIDLNAIAKTQATLPDTLMNRQRNQLAIAADQTKAHDQPLLNQAMALYAQGNAAGAQSILQGVQGDASEALKFGADNQYRNATLGLQRERLNLARASAAQRANQASSQAKGLMSLYKSMLGVNAGAENAETKAATAFQVEQQKDNENNNPLNNPKNNVNGTVQQLNSDNNKWYLPDSNRGDKLKSLVKQLDPKGTLNDKQTNNLLQLMNESYGAADSFFGSSNPEAAALARGKEAIDALQQAQQGRLQSTKNGIDAKKTTDMQRQQLLLELLMRSGVPMNLPNQFQPTDDEDF